MATVEAKRRADARYRAKNREKYRLKTKAWRAANPDRKRQADASHRRNNAERISRQKRAKYAANAKAERAARRARYAVDPTRALAANTKYHKANPDVIKAIRRNQRARKRNAEGSHSAQDIAFLRKVQRNKCANEWCRVSLKRGSHVDHIIPLALGGSNDRKNLQLLCRPCNLEKHAKHPIDFAQEHGLLL